VSAYAVGHTVHTLNSSERTVNRQKHGVCDCKARVASSEKLMVHSSFDFEGHTVARAQNATPLQALGVLGKTVTIIRKYILMSGEGADWTRFQLHQHLNGYSKDKRGSRSVHHRLYVPINTQSLLWFGMACALSVQSLRCA